MSTNGDEPLFLTSASERGRIWIGLKPESLASSPISIGRRAPCAGPLATVRTPRRSGSRGTGQHIGLIRMHIIDSNQRV